MVKNRPTIALFGGSFDPPHRGHQAIVDAISSFEDIDKLIVMPAFLNPFKEHTLAPAQQRLAWCKKVFHTDKVTVSDFEISQERAVYTIETLEMLEKQYHAKYLVIGADNLAQLRQWKAFDEINSRITWVVVARGSDSLDCHLLKQCKQLAVEIPISSTEIRNGHYLEQVDSRIRAEVAQRLQQKENHDN